MKRVTQSRTRPRTTGLLVGILFLVPLLAIVNAAVGPYAVLPYLAIASMVAFFALPLSFLVMTCLVVSAVLAGLLEYFGKISQGFWLPYLMGALFALRALGERLRLGAMPTDSLVSVQRPPFGPFIVVYLAVLLFTTLVALPPMAQIVVATKNYIFLWGLMLVLLWSPWDVKDSTRFWTAVIAIACIQWPITAYQHFVVAAKRHDAAAWDAVVGTFGGSPDSGGHSAAMAMASCVAIAALLFRAREKRIGAAAAALLIGFCLLPIGLAEVKAAFIWLLMVFMLFFARQFKREPVKALMILVFGMSLLGGIGWIYKATMYEASSNGSLQDIYDKQIKYALDPNEFSSEYRRLGRVAALVFWAQQHDLRVNPVHVLVGHGMGASRSSSTVAPGEVARKYSVEVDTTAASTLLWDTGLLGTVAFTGLLVVGALYGVRQSQRMELDPAWRETAFVSGAFLAMSALCVLYNRDPIDTPVVEMLIFFSLAQVMLVSRQPVGAATPVPQAHTPAAGRMRPIGGRYPVRR